MKKQMLKVLSAMLCMVLLLSTLSIPSFAVTASGECGENVSWSYNDGVLEIYGQGKTEDYGLLGDKPWREYMEDITKVIIGEGITFVSSYAFYGCEVLTDVELPSTLTELSDGMFYCCNSLKEIELPSAITELPRGVFSACGFESFDIPDTITVIGKHVFNACENLESVTIPDSVTEIGDYAFSNTGLKSVTIPGSIKIIGGCEAEDEGAINEAPFQYCKNLESVILLDGVETIGMCAFIDCPSLKYVKIPDSVTSVEYGAFALCSSLESIIFPESINSIDRFAFYSCKKLKDVYFKGTQAQWEEIPIGEENEYLINATMHYDYIEISDVIPEDNKIIKTPSVTTVKYGDTLILHSGIEKLPEGMRIEWKADSTAVTLIPSENSLTCEVVSVEKAEVTITAMITDAEGNPVLDESGNEIVTEQTITSKVNFWLKIVSFFKNLFGMNRIIEQAVGIRVVNK